VLGLLKREEDGEDINLLLGAQLAQVLRTALTHVPHYRDLGLGIEPQEITAESAGTALQLFPYLEKSTVMKMPEAFVSDSCDPQRLKSVTSGGSTGQGIRLYRDRPDQSAEAAFFHHRWGGVGYHRSSRTVRVGVEGRKQLGEEPCSRYGDRLLVSPYHFTEEWIGRICDEIEAYHPRYFHMYPSSFEYLARYLEQSGRRIPGLLGIFLASERVSERQLELAESVFPSVPVVFHYGLSERTNLAWGAWRDGRVTYDFEPAYGYAENFEHENGVHEIVGTSYWNETMPLIRYRTQDLGRIRDGSMRNLEGREHEFLVTKSGVRIPGIGIMIDDFLFDNAEGVQVVQNVIGKLELRVKPKPGFDSEIADRVLASQRSQWGDAFEFSLSFTDRIELTPSGKIRRYIVNLPQSH